MDTRVLHLLETPELLQQADLPQIESEIIKYPFVQSIRALHLVGIHKFQPDSFEQNLSVVAAYSTDKKNLYRVLHNKISDNVIPQPNNSQENEPEELPDLGAEPQEIQYSTEDIVNENNASENEVENEAELSFHGVDDFLPAVKFSPKKEADTPRVVSQKIDKAEDEMARLIAEVEAKMKLNKTPKLVEDELDNFEINFAENFDAAENSIIQEPQAVQTPPSENEISADEPSGHSNVGVFINTWQSWLKLDKKAENDTETLENFLAQKSAIDLFLEKDPKISRLRKEELPSTKKERSENISHLMTETLAQLYTNQKHYQKAVDAYEILKVKNPEKASFFDEKIAEIQTLRQNIK